MSRLPAWVRRLWPRRLAGQMIALMLLALILSQILTLVIFADERRIAIRALDRSQTLARTESVVRLLGATPTSLHDDILRNVSSPRLQFSLAEQSLVEPVDGEEDDDDELAPRLQAMLAGTGVRAVRAQQIDEDGWRDRRHCERPFREHRRGAEEARSDDDRAEHGSGPRWRNGRCLPAVRLAAQLPDGRWLNVVTPILPPPVAWGPPYFLSLGLMALAISAVVVLMVRRITRPMAALALAAEQVGRGEQLAPLAEAGPADLRQTIAAFNRMQARLGRFVADRTRMLAAISHDLRTPITTLRLRAEFIDDPETRERILATLEEMQRMTEATLAFAREEAAVEPTRRVDLAALVESVAADLADLGHDVAFAPALAAPYPCRSVALKRAVRNLIENAIRYGQRARVSLEAGLDEVRIVVEDDGPGIPPAEQERVFEPFVRLEESRSDATGGIGLGLAIARSIAHGHGGDITLANRPEGGLRAVLHLPATSAQGAA